MLPLHVRAQRCYAAAQTAPPRVELQDGGALATGHGRCQLALLGVMLVSGGKNEWGRCGGEEGDVSGRAPTFAGGLKIL